MSKAIARDPIYRRRRFHAEIIELCVRWYITYRLSYRDLVAMMAERGIDVSHTTILRWVLHYVPEFEKRWARLCATRESPGASTRHPIAVRGRWHYLYRAVDKHGKSVDFLLCADPRHESKNRKTVTTQPSRWPRKVNLDGNTASHRALRLLRQEDSKVAVRRRAQSPLSQQHRRARPSRGQTPLCSDDGLQVLQHRGRHIGRDRTCASHSQATVLVRARSLAPCRVAEGALGPALA